MKLSEQFLLFNLSPQGELSAIENRRLKRTLLMAGLIDLALAGSLAEQSGRLTLQVKNSSIEQALEPLVEYLRLRPGVELDQVAYDYLVALTGHWHELFQSLGRSLSRQEAVTVHAHSGMITRLVFLPIKSVRDQRLWELQWELSQPDMALTYYCFMLLLEQSGQLPVLMSRADINRWQALKTNESAEKAKHLLQRYQLK